MKRFWEIDFLRGIAVVMMVLFHAMFDLKTFAGVGPDIDYFFWLFFGRATAVIFLFLVGVSLTINYSRARKPLFSKYLVRGLKIFAWGLIITISTWMFFKQNYIIFGVLHFIGVSVIIGFPFIRLRYLNLLFGSALVILGLYMMQLKFSFSYLMWLGFVPVSLNTFDYFPLLPWFGVVLLGIFAGNILFFNGKRKYRIKDVSNFATRPVCWLGRHSLLIYIVHQPLLMLLLYLVFFI